MAFPLHHCHKSCRCHAGLSRTRIVSRSHRWHSHSQTKSKARDEPNIQNVPTTSKMWLDCTKTCRNKLRIFFGSFYSASCLSLGDFSVVWASQSTCKRHDLQRLWYLADGWLLFIFNLSNAESRGTWKGWRTFAWIRMNCHACQAVVRRHWLQVFFFFFFFLCLRGGEDSERGETKFSAGVTVTAPTTMHAEERQQSVPRDVQKCEQEDWAAVSGSERIAPYRLDQSRVEAYSRGFSQTSIFIPTPFSGRTNGAQWRQGESKFLPCFS